jgi:hypothetical protein
MLDEYLRQYIRKRKAKIGNTIKIPIKRLPRKGYINE